MAKLTNTMSEVHGHITIEPGWKDDVWTLQQWYNDTSMMPGRAITITTSELIDAAQRVLTADPPDADFDVMSTISPEQED